MNLAVERFTFYHIIIITNTINVKSDQTSRHTTEQFCHEEHESQRQYTYTCQEMINIVLGIPEKEDCSNIYLQYALKKKHLIDKNFITSVQFVR